MMLSCSIRMSAAIMLVLEFSNQTFMLEDLHSSNGTRLNGLRIRHTVVLHNRDVIGFGCHMQFEICLQQHSSRMSAVLRSLESQALQHYYVLFIGNIFVGSEEECEVYIPHLITTDIPYLFKMAYRAPYWYFHIRPHAPTIKLNGTPVRDYIVITPGDVLSFEGITMLFE